MAGQKIRARHSPTSSRRSSLTAGSPTSPRGRRRTHRRLGSANSSTSVIGVRPRPRTGRARLVGGLINTGDCPDAAVRASAVGARAFLRTGRCRPSSADSKAGRAVVDVSWLPGRFPRRIAPFSGPATRPPLRPDGPRGPPRTDRPKSKLLSVVMRLPVQPTGVRPCTQTLQPRQTNDPSAGSTSSEQNASTLAPGC